MNARAVEMAKIIVEEWPEGMSAELFALRRFKDDTIEDLEAALDLIDAAEAQRRAHLRVVK